MSPNWIAVDWGTTRLRAWAMGPRSVLAEAASDAGMGALSSDGFEPALTALIGGWGEAPVIACGMVGSRQGWQEAPYRATPCAPVEPGALVAVRGAARSVRIVPGLKQTQPADVMRGEETQIAGVLARQPGFDGVICLPGTHSKWARLSAGEVVGFQTFLTGEMFALLAEHSVLRHSMAEGWDDAAFDDGAAEGLARPERLLALLFRLRAEGLLRGLPGAEARARLSGLLIGAELAAARGWWLGMPVCLVGAPGLCRLYARALATQGAPATQVASDVATLAGLALAAGLTPVPA